MRYIDLLIENIDYYGKEWWRESGNLHEAREIIDNALNEEIEENQVAILISLLEPEENEFEGISPEKVCKRYLKKMKKDIRDEDDF
jgi:hypothetical protein